MKKKQWRYHDAIPADGVYLCRMDEDDDEPLELTVKEGKAYKADGSQRIVMGHEWLAVEQAK